MPKIRATSFSYCDFCLQIQGIESPQKSNLEQWGERLQFKERNLDFHSYLF